MSFPTRFHETFTLKAEINKDYFSYNFHILSLKHDSLPDHLSSPPIFSGVRVTRFLVLCVCFVDRCLSFCTFLLTIVLSVLLRYANSVYPGPLLSSNSS